MHIHAQMNDSRERNPLITYKVQGMMYTAGALAASIAFFATRFRSVPANQYFAKTGFLVNGVHVSRKTFLLPFQKLSVINLDPINYHFLGNNMSKEFVPFSLPLIFTVSPIHPEEDANGFIRYATRLGNLDHEAVKNIIGGIVHGETRGFVGSMTIQEIFSDKEAFRNNVVERVQKDLEQFGLKIHNANIEEMHDTEGNSYFSNLKRKALEEANTQSRIFVSEAQKEGDIGEKNREVTTRRERAIMEADAQQTEKKESQRVSEYTKDLAIAMIVNKRMEELSKIEAYQTTENKRIEVESELNRRRQQEELERLRTKDVITATAEAEALIKTSEAGATVIKIKADADAIAMKTRAEAEFFANCKQAEAIRLQLEAQASGLERLYEVSRTNPELASFYLALEKGLFSPHGIYSVIADKQAEAIRGLEPKIHIWNTGEKDNYANVIANLTKTLPPILDVVQEQTGIKLPAWASVQSPK